MMRKRIRDFGLQVSFLFFLLLTPGLRAQVAPNGPIIQSLNESSPSEFLLARSVAAAQAKPQPKIGKEFWALVITSKALKVWDIELTQRRMRRNPYWQEAWPLLSRRPCRPAMYAEFIGLDLLADYLSWRLRRAGHPNWARAIQSTSIGFSVGGIVRNSMSP